MSQDEPSLFGLLVLSLGNAALMSLGHMPDPATNQMSRDLEAATHNIDLLIMLQEKTKTNLTTEEHQLLDGLLYDLRLKYVEAARKA